MITRNYDLIVVGAGAAGLAAAIRYLDAHTSLACSNRCVSMEVRAYHEFVRAQLRQAGDATPAWLICDSRFLWKYGLGRGSAGPGGPVGDVRAAAFRRR